MKWGCLGIAVSAIVGTILRGWVLAKFWAWFIVPLGVVPISIPWALGLSAFAYFLLSPKSEDFKGKPGAEAIFKACFTMVGAPLFCLALGYVWAWIGGLL